MRKRDQQFLDEIDTAADRLLNEVNVGAAHKLAERLMRAHGTESNAVSMAAFAVLVGELLNDAPAANRGHLAVVFMRLVQRNMDDD